VAVFALNAPQHPTGKIFGSAPRHVDSPSSGSGSGTSMFIMRYKLLDGRVGIVLDEVKSGIDGGGKREP
jgi:hypothetical protein